ncbi:putative negative regulator of RcsB-dependent stress response [Paenibacillus phyllosphaerae]|uniref:Putative negative regulator of RcsB-dependent stress response n=1 Tax=Paenibacillus phyllosphaerae TaxID=274593 RepID=A0A7W5AWN5_9BACL|nr:hypothetical protein [Paenibacillus phyllosphaerae]MBB3110062.1 putative negative regulator of RcsB-dependent stress response [Paenibacillus phyllosphaerae]
MSEKVYLLTICLPLATILIIFGMRYFSAVQQAKYRSANDEAYRQIAEKAVASQTEAAAALTSIDAALTDVRTRLTAVEKVLKQID